MGRSKKAAWPLVWESETLRCTLCGAFATGRLPDLQRAGWDWFKGCLPQREEVCPACATARAGEWAEVVNAARTVWAVPAEVAEHFWSTMPPGARPEGACWPWRGLKLRREKTGKWYGQMKAGGVNLLAHRVSWELHRGRIPAGKVIAHTCGNSACVNPDHLTPSSRLEVVRRTDAAGLRNAKGKQGSAHPHAKLTEADVRAIRDAAARGASLTRLAAEYGITHESVRLIVHRKTWKHIE